MRKVLLFIYFICLYFIPHISYSQLVSDFKVNTDGTNYNQNNSKVGVDAEGNFVIVWDDGRRNANPDVYFQRYNKFGAPLGVNTKVNNSIYLSGSPEIAMKPNGNFFLCWYDYNGSVNRIRLKYFNSNGDSLSGTINFIDDLTNQAAYYKMDLAPTGNLIVSWIEMPFKIYYQIFDSNGVKAGSNILIDQSEREKRSNSVCVREDGSFIVCYDESNGGGGNYVMARLFNKDGNFISVTRVNDITDIWDQYTRPSVSTDSLGRFSIAFNYYNLNSNSNSVCYQMFNKDGSKKGNNVFYGGGFGQYNSFVVKKKNGEMLLSYSSGSAPYQSVYLKTDTAGKIAGPQFLVSGESPASTKFLSDGKILKDRIISTWIDNRYGNLDIFCNIRSYVNPDSVVSINNISTTIPEDFKLYQNYPNPFNPETTIKFDVKKTGLVSIKVYDMLGSEKMNLLDENLQAGSYAGKFNLSGLGSGIYFYRIKANNFVDTKRMVLIK